MSAASPTPRWGGEDRPKRGFDRQTEACVGMRTEAASLPTISGTSHPEALPPPQKGAEDLRLITGRGSEVAAAAGVVAQKTGNVPSALPAAGALAAPAGMIPKQPSLRTRDEVRSSIRCLLMEGFNFRQCMAIFRSHLVDVAIEQAGRSMKRACVVLGLSRYMLRRHRDAGREISR